MLLYSQDILSQRTVALHIEVNPRYLIPDTNCFVDDLISINAIANAHPLYQLMIPITGKIQFLFFLFNQLCCTIDIKERAHETSSGRDCCFFFTTIVQLSHEHRLEREKILP